MAYMPFKRFIVFHTIFMKKELFAHLICFWVRIILLLVEGIACFRHMQVFIHKWLLFLQIEDIESDFRDSYKALLKLIPDKVTKIFKGLFSVYQHHFRLLYHARLASTTSVFIWPDFFTRRNEGPTSGIQLQNSLGRAMSRPTGPLLFFSIFGK